MVLLINNITVVANDKSEAKEKAIEHFKQGYPAWQNLKISVTMVKPI